MAPSGVGEEEPSESMANRTNRKEKSSKNKEEKEVKSEENERKKSDKKNEKEDEKEKEEDKDDSQEREKAPTAFEKLCYKLNINPNLVMLKVTLFMMYGATASLLPYLTIHMQSIGLTVEEIAIVYLALPLTTFLSPPVTGFLVDKMGNYKPVVILTLVLNAAFHHSLLLIPAMETPGVMPPAYVMRHPVTGKVDVWWSPCPSRECPDDEELDLVLDDCLDHCLLLEPEEQPKKKTLLQEIHQGIAVRPPTLLPEEKVTKEDADKVVLAIKGPGGPNDGLNFTSKPKKTKKANSTNATGVVLVTTSTPKSPVTDTPSEPVFVIIEMHPDLMDPIEQLGMEMQPDENETVNDFTAHFSQKLMEDAGVNYTALLKEDLRCGGAVLATNLTYKTLTELAADCMLQKCFFREGGPEMCPPDFQESDDRIFWIYFLLRFVGTIMLSAGVTMLDPIALTMIQQHGGQFGRERLFSSVGMAIFSPLCGLLIDQSSAESGVTDYSSAFYTYDVLLLVSCVTLALMPIGGNVPAENIMKDLLRLLKMPHVMCFILFLFALGNFWGFIESFLFLYLKELGAPNYLLGITVTVGTLSSIPFLYGADKITSRFGHVNVIVLAFFSHAARLMGYSFIETAWWCFPFEAIESLAVHLMWVAAATYCSILAPKTLLATLIGVLGMAHFSLGRGFGSFLGGLLIGSYGTRKAFRIMGLLACAGGTLYGLLHLLWLKKYDKVEKDVEDGEVDRLNGGAGDDDAEGDDEEENNTKMSIERLSLMVQFNMRGSMTSLDGLRSAAGGMAGSVSRTDLRGSRPSMDRRGSALDYRSGRGSVSRIDLRKSAIEINHLQATLRSSNPQLGLLNASQPSTKVLTPQALRKNQRNLSVNALGPESRRDSIREEEEHDREDRENTAKNGL